MKEYAKQYYDLELNPSCISYIKTKYNTKENNPEKSPYHSWKKWQVSRPLIEEVMELNWEVSNGIGAVLGHTSRCIDIDNCNNYDFVKEFLKLLRLPSNYEWVVKSPNGFHIHLRSGAIYLATYKELIDGVLPVFPNIEFASVFSKIELRWANHIVLPPTKINGKKYSFVNDNFPKVQPARVDMFYIFSALLKFCGNDYNGFGNFETQKMVFQLASPSEGYPYIHAAHGSNKEGVIKGATNSVGFINFKSLPKNIRAGFLELEVGNLSYPIKNWYVRPEIFIDIETTGIVKNEFDYESYPRILQIAYYNSYKKEFKSIYVKPDGFNVPKEIENLTGLNSDYLAKNGVSIVDAFRLIEFPENSPIIGHNLDFDLSIIDSEFLRILKGPESYINNKLRNGAQTFCIMKKFASLFEVKYPKLSEMFNFFFDDNPPHKMHDAINDLKVLIDCYHIMRLYGYITKDYENQLIV